MSSLLKFENPRLLKMKIRRDQLDARIQKQEAVSQQKEKARNTRRRFVAGDIVLAQAEIDPEFNYQLCALLDAALNGKTERALFGLPETPSTVWAAVAGKTS